MVTLKLEVSERVNDLMKSGVVTIHASFFKSGVDIYARCVQPHPRLNVFPHESYQIDELEQKLKKVQVHQSVKLDDVLGKHLQKEGSKTPSGDEGVKLPVPTGNRLPTTSTSSGSTGVKVIRHFDSRLHKQVPHQVVINGVANILPSDSIAWRDLAFLDDSDLIERVDAVAAAVTAEKAWARIVQINYDKGKTSSYHDLESWWEHAHPEMRFTLISSTKKAGGKPTNFSQLLGRLRGVRCPFRDSDRLVQEGSEEEEEEEDLSWEEQLKLFGAES
jgi:hypothetical protein